MGCPVGSALGWDVGYRLGRVVGSNVGMNVGGTVGAGVGVSVGVEWQDMVSSYEPSWPARSPSTASQYVPGVLISYLRIEQ